MVLQNHNSVIFHFACFPTPPAAQRNPISFNATYGVHVAFLQMQVVFEYILAEQMYSNTYRFL